MILVISILQMSLMENSYQFNVSCERNLGNIFFEGAIECN